MNDRVHTLVAAVLAAALVVPAGLPAAHPSSPRAPNGGATVAAAVGGGGVQPSSDVGCCLSSGDCGGRACAVASGCTAPVFLPADASLSATTGVDAAHSGTVTGTPTDTVLSDPPPPPRG